MAQYSQLSDLIEIVKRLRSECPWDKVQTRQSLAAPLIEEAYETVEAIENNNVAELKKELGDLLLHVVFQSEIASEQQEFAIEDVIAAECEKLIYRHPHIFGDTTATTAEEVSKNWEQLKRKEAGRTSILDGVPAAMPALQRAERIQEKASKVGFDWDNAESVLKKVREELDEFLTAQTQAEKEEEFGDLLFSLVNFSRHAGIEAERALRAATDKFNMRFRSLEKAVEETKKPIIEHSLEELDFLWNTIKNKEK